MLDVRRLLHLADPMVTVETATASDGVSQIVTISDVTKDDFMNKVMEAAGFYKLKSSKETANFGVVTYSNEYGEDSEDIELANGEENETEDHSENGPTVSDTNSVELSTLSDESIDGDGRELQILVDGDGHKLANKIFTEMLGNEGDMTRYGSFLYDLDNFLNMYKGEPPDEDDEDEDEDEDEEKPKRIGNIKDKKDKKKKEKASSVSAAEVASILLNCDANHFYVTFKDYMPETANVNTVTKLIIGIVIKVIVTALGKAFITAWDNKDKGFFENLLFKLVRIIANDFFPTEDESDDSLYEKYQDARYDGRTIDLDDYEYDDDYYESAAFIEEASAEIATLDLNTIETASILKVRIVRAIIGLMLKLMAGYIGKEIANAWIRRDKNGFKRSMDKLMRQIAKSIPMTEKASVDGLYDDFNELVEIAKKRKPKNPRSALLSALMRAMSGDIGKEAVEAWEKQDYEGLGDALGKASNKVLEAMPVDEDKVDTSTNDDDDEDTDIAADDGSDDTDV